MGTPSSLLESPLASASWIWLSCHDASDTYACFRRPFSLSEQADDGFLDLSVDTDFVAYLNGHEIGRGQFSDFPRRKSWSRLMIPSVLLESENVLAIAVHYRGTDAFDHQKGKPGLIGALQIGRLTIPTDQTWKARLHPAFRSGYSEPVTPQTGLTFHFDARRDEKQWTTPGYMDRDWPVAAIVQQRATEGYWCELTPRPLPPLTLGELPEVKVALQGALFLRDRATSVAQSMANTALRSALPWFVFENPALSPSFPGSATIHEASIKAPANAYQGAPLNAGAFLSKNSDAPLVIRPPESRTDGQFLIIDLIQETVGILELEIEAEEGTIIDIAHGEHLDDGRVRMKIGQRNFADRYICSGGKQHFQMPFRRIAARYLEVHCFSPDRLKIFTLTLRPLEYSVGKPGDFEVPDPLAMKVHHAAVRTLELCRHEHYEDCPWREQALYGYDSRLQALYGYYAFGDYQFPAVSFKMLHETLRESGFLGLIAPGHHPATIPCFSLTWIAAIAEHWLYSGSSVLYQQVAQTIEKVITSALSRRDAATGLYLLPEGDNFWHFYEWTAGLAGEENSRDQNGAPLLHAAYQLHLHEALRSVIWLRKHSDKSASVLLFERKLKSLGEAIHLNFWDTEAGLYRTQKKAGDEWHGSHELIQALALYEDIVPEHEKRRLTNRIINGDLVSATLSGSHYLMVAMLAQSPESRSWAVRHLSSRYEAMILAGATTLWETAAGGADFDYAGSLCHGWSAQPIYLHQAINLGIVPLEPGFRRFSIRICPGRHLAAEGTIPTPFGKISVKWFKERKGLFVEISAPKECHPEIAPYPESPYAEVIVKNDG